jgi:hypothetical protein
MPHDAFAVPLSRSFVTALVHATRPVWRWLGNLETRLMADRLDGVGIDRPIYVTGLARAGSTILLEFLASHPDTVSHQYRDFPFLWTPGWWHQVLDQNVKGYLEPAERAHGDRIEVTPESPEAMEEVLWMGFFDHLHDPGRSSVLRGTDTNAKFDRFYTDHIRKLLSIHSGSRYLAKGNYNVTRLEYLQRLFEDALFIIPIREPGAQVASLRKQHRLFCEAAAEHPRSIGYLSRVGHFEFGANRRPIHTGSDELIASIQKLWADGEEARGWARYWAAIYDHVADTLDANPTLAEKTRIVRYEDLCSATPDTLQGLMDHCGLDGASLVDRWRDRISPPDYYEPRFSVEELAAIADETAETAARFGYTYD